MGGGGGGGHSVRERREGQAELIGSGIEKSGEIRNTAFSCSNILCRQGVCNVEAKY